MIEQINDTTSKQIIARKILEALRDWFEVDENREKYIVDSADQIFLAAVSRCLYLQRFVPNVLF